MSDMKWQELYLEWKRVVLLATIAVFLFFVIVILAWSKSDQKETSPRQEDAAFTLEMSARPAEHMRGPLHDWELHYRTPEQQDEQNRIAKSVRIFGGIVPHHLAAQSFIAEMFQLLADREHIPKTVVILSPNHLETGESFVQTANMVWDTSDGSVSTDVSKLEEIAESFGTSLYNEGMRREHGVYHIIPFVQHFLPDAHVVPITLRFATSSGDQDRLVEILLKWLKQNDDVVVIASIDFSHYLSSEEAEKKDTETRIAMERYDFSEIASYRSDHVDTPAGLIVLLRTMQSIDANHQTILQYDNSGRTLNRPFTKTTSHFLMTFTRTE